MRRSRRRGSTQSCKHCLLLPTSTGWILPSTRPVWSPVPVGQGQRAATTLRGVMLWRWWIHPYPPGERRSPPKLVEVHGDHQHNAHRKVTPETVQPDDDETVREGGWDQRANDRTDHRAHAPEQARASDHYGGDHVEAVRRVTSERCGAELCEAENSREPREDPRGRTLEEVADPRQCQPACCLGISTDRVGAPTKPCRPQHGPRWSATAKAIMTRSGMPNFNVLN
ncbi:hypothetical protein FQR65_LT18438 [Abscondita terminalis]|nr:hypothetical protein FQR65_LT18438 [Abscondita terminalis]